MNQAALGPFSNISCNPIVIIVAKKIFSAPELASGEVKRAMGNMSQS